MAATTPFTIGADATCTDGVCDTVSRSAGGRDAVDAAGSRPRLGRVPLALHRGVVTRHG